MPNQMIENPPTSIENMADLLIDISSTLMTSGAHTMRIKQNISRMAEHFGYNVDISVFQISMMMTLTNNNDPKERITLIKKMKPLLINFTFVSNLSSLSWDTIDKNMTYKDVKATYEEIISEKRMSRWLVLVLVGFGNAAFCGIFQGDLAAMGLVLIATLVGFYVRQELINRQVNHYVIFTASAFIASIIAGLGFVFNLTATPEPAFAASVLYLIPGVPLINSVLDIIQGHVLIGTSRLINATGLIVCISIGMFISMLILGMEKI